MPLAPNRKRKRKRKRKHKNDVSSSDDDDDDYDDLRSDMHRINRKREKKLLKDITVAVSTPLALGLKYLLTERTARSQSYEAAILLRAIKPVTTDIQQILKNDKLIEWDHPLLTAVIRALYHHHIDVLESRGKTAIASKLKTDLVNLLDLLAEDQLLLTPAAVYSVFIHYSWGSIFEGIHLLLWCRSSVTEPENRCDPLSGDGIL